MTQIKVYQILGKHPIYENLFHYPLKDVSYIDIMFSGTKSDITRWRFIQKK